MKSVDLMCSACGSSFQMEFKLISNDTGKEVEFTSIECPECHELGLGPFGDVEELD